LDYLFVILLVYHATLLVVRLIAWLFEYLKQKIYGRTTKAYRLDNEQRYYGQFPELEASIRELSQIAWSTEQAFCDPSFCLNPKVMTRMTDPEEILDTFLCHARRIAPGFAVPHMVLNWRLTSTVEYLLLMPANS
jgi:hypothetical protein